MATCLPLSAPRASLSLSLSLSSAQLQSASVPVRRAPVPIGRPPGQSSGSHDHQSSSCHYLMLRAVGVRGARHQYDDENTAPPLWASAISNGGRGMAMVGRALSRAHHSSVWTASSLRVFMYGLHVCIRYSYGGRFGTVPSFLSSNVMVCARAVGVRARAHGPVSGVCSVVRPVKLSSGSTVMYADHERCVCALLCASGVALHNLCGFESIQNLPGEWMIRSTTAGMGVRAHLHTGRPPRWLASPASSRDILLTSEPGLGLAILRLGARLDRLSSSGTCEESTRGDPCCGPSAFTCSPRRVFGASRTPSTQLSWGHGAAHKLPSQPR